MPNEVDSSKTLIPVWTPNQSAQIRHLERDGRYTVIPLTQHTCASSIQALPEYWPGCSYDSLNKTGDEALDAWQSISQMRGIDSSRVLMWRAAREAAYIECLLNNYRESQTVDFATIGAVMPQDIGGQSIEALLTALPVFVLRDYARQNGLGFKLIAGKQSLAADQVSAALPLNLLDIDVPFDACVLTYGIPDLGRIVSERAAQPGHTLFIASPDCNAQIKPLSELIGPLENLSICQLGGNSPARYAGSNFEARDIERFGHMAPFLLASFCAYFSAHHAAEITRLSSSLCSFLEQVTSSTLIFANHDSPYTRAMLDTALKIGAQTDVFEHSLWPLRAPPFVLPLSLRLRGRHFYFTNSAMEQVPDPGNDFFVRKLQPWSTLRVNQNKVRLREVQRKFSEQFQGIIIGVVVTTGQAHVAPDISLKKVYKHISNLCAQVLSLEPHAEIILRVRDAQDNLDLLLPILRGHIGEAGLRRVGLSKLSEEPFHKFVQLCHRIVEAGMPTSAIYEAFAHKVPVYRLMDPESDSERFTPRPLGELQPEHNACSGIVGLLDPQQGKLTKAQSRFLRQELAHS